jgi:hypothetical protein
VGEGWGCFASFARKTPPYTSLVSAIPIETSWTKSTPRDEKRTYFQDSQKSLWRWMR